jgi:hypothetical protein
MTGALAQVVRRKVALSLQEHNTYLLWEAGQVFLLWQIQALEGLILGSRRVVDHLFANSRII